MFLGGFIPKYYINTLETMKTTEEINIELTKVNKILRQELKDAENEIEDLEYKNDSLNNDIEFLEERVLFETKTLEDEQKAELLHIAFYKYSLKELEKRLGGNSFELRKD
jgi:translation initiation factor 2B subunit (eIF-2B alpha/beta/delta family)